MSVLKNIVIFYVRTGEAKYGFGGKIVYWFNNHSLLVSMKIIWCKTIACTLTSCTLLSKCCRTYPYDQGRWLKVTPAEALPAKAKCNIDQGRQHCLLKYHPPLCKTKAISKSQLNHYLFFYRQLFTFLDYRSECSARALLAFWKERSSMEFEVKLMAKQNKYWKGFKTKCSTREVDILIFSSIHMTTLLKCTIPLKMGGGIINWNIKCFVSNGKKLSTAALWPHALRQINLESIKIGSSKVRVWGSTRELSKLKIDFF